MRFEWDREKAAANRKKHKISFEEAVSVFYDPLAATFEDPDQSKGESRFVTVGYSTSRDLLVVCHTEREETLRIVSARKATADERKRHEE